jgi:tetratricopeptide (TPR) repeat protein
MSLHHLGVVHSDLFKFDDALAFFMRALKIRRSLGDGAERDTASTLNNMAAVLHQLGRNEQCLAVYGKALEIKRKLLPPTHPSIADTLYNMGALNLEINRPSVASDYFIHALTISTTRLGMSHPLSLDLQKQILTCDTLAAQLTQDGGGGGGDGGAAGDDLAQSDLIADRLRLETGAFTSEYNRDRAGSSGEGSASTVLYPPSMTPPSGADTPNSGGTTPKGPKSRRALTGQAMSVLATPPMSPLTRFD